MSKKYLEGTRIEDIRWQKFGKLTVVDFNWGRYEKDKIRHKNGEIKHLDKHWICKCECGKFTDVSKNHLKSGHTTSCGMCYTFEDWCIDNNHQDYLDLWDYELNGCSPNEIGYGMGKKYYFKCPRGIHDSELWLINNLTSKNKYRSQNVELSCRRCNSFGQYLLDTHGNLDMWSDKNTVDPFEITRRSGRVYYLKCPECGKIKPIAMDIFARSGISCNRCGDGFSIPEKMFKGVLDQLRIEYKTQLNKSDFDWIGKYRYDFYIPSLNLIVETHGGQHYISTTIWKTLEEEQSNDKLKKDLAIQNGFNYCVIDCRYSELEWLKDNIVKEFGRHMDLDNVDWIKAIEYTQKTMVKDVCDYWNSKKVLENTQDLSDAFHISQNTVRTYLKRGTVIGWCHYDAKEERKKTNSIIGKNNNKYVEIFKDEKSLGIFESVAELERQSETLFGIKLNGKSISSACLGRQNRHKGYVFRYI